MYIESGGVTEYCKGYGIPFTNDDLPEKLNWLCLNMIFTMKK